jgi:hypothetical protein
VFGAANPVTDVTTAQGDGRTLVDCESIRRERDNVCHPPEEGRSVRRRSRASSRIFECRYFSDML